MESHKLAVKFFADGTPTLPGDAFIPVFHSWIQQKALTGHLMIDVADYAHVPEGPGTVLVCKEANLSMDSEDNQLGLLYVRKQPVEGADTFPDRLRAVLRSALEACAKLEEEVSLRGKLRFRTDEFAFRIYDRLAAPNDPATLEKVKPELQKVVGELYAGANVTLERRGTSGELFEVRVKAPGAGNVATLRKRL